MLTEVALSLGQVFFGVIVAAAQRVVDPALRLEEAVGAADCLKPIRSVVLGMAEVDPGADGACAPDEPDHPDQR